MLTCGIQQICQMSPEIETAQSQWLAQLASMRQAIAELNLASTDCPAPEYGHDLLLDESDLTGGSGSDDIWDILSEEESDEYSSDFPDNVQEPATNGHFDGSYKDVEWLRTKTTTLADQRFGLDAHDLRGQILALLVSDSSGLSTCAWYRTKTDNQNRKRTTDISHGNRWLRRFGFCYRPHR